MLRNKGTHEKILDALNLVARNDYMIYVRPNGEIAGLCPPSSDQVYYDEQHDMKRSRVKYWELDGGKNLDSRDGISQEKGSKVDLIKIEMTGGIALTELTEENNREPIYTGRQAEKIRQKDESVQAMANELNRMGKEYKTKDKNYRDLQKKVNNLKEEKQEAEEDREHFRNANERLNKRNESLKARLTAKEEKIKEFKRELSALSNRHEKLADEIENILEKVTDIRIEKSAASGLEASEEPKSRGTIEEGGQTIKEEVEESES